MERQALTKNKEQIMDVNEMKKDSKKLLFIDRDGTLVEEPFDEQVDSFEKLKFVPGVFKSLSFIKEHTDFHLILVSNQDGLGTNSFPQDTFKPVHDFIIGTLAGEGIIFEAQHIDNHFPEDNSPMRKPGIGMLKQYLDNPIYDIANSFVIGDRDTDAELAHNIGCKSLILGKDGMTWDKIAELLFAGERHATIVRNTKETRISVAMNLDGSGQSSIHTGLGFFDHMLEQIARHGKIDMDIVCDGDLYVDEHHTIEDTAIVIGQCIDKCLGSKRGIERYGYCLPMDDCLCRVALDFGGRPWLNWNVAFRREKIGDVPTEMFFHFFKSISDAAKMNLDISAHGENEHHKIEGVFKGFARAIRMAVRRDINNFDLPSTKGTL